MAHEATLLRQGKIGVLPTDTVYGVVASALDPVALERVYRVKSRMPVKPPIILIASVEDLTLFGVSPTAAQRVVLDTYWPGQVSIVLPCDDERFAYLHRGAKSLAFRLPALPWLRAFLSESGPLMAPSANLEGQPPATTIAEARNYFGDGVDFYIDGGVLVGRPSTIIRLNPDGSQDILRK